MKLTNINNYNNYNSYNNYATPNFKAIPKGYSKVDDYLIRGHHPSIKELWNLKKEGVNQVYDFRHHSNFGCKFIEKFACKLFGIKYNRLPYSNLYGDYPSIETFEKVAKNVKENGENGGKTLFHCNSGRHRTSHFSAFYDITKGEPLNNIKSNPNYNEIVQKSLKEQISDKNYFSRKRIEYTGHNPIKKIIANINNRITDGLNIAQKIFTERLS
jgi:hypothetical protein